MLLNLTFKSRWSQFLSHSLFMSCSLFGLVSILLSRFFFSFFFFYFDFTWHWVLFYIGGSWNIFFLKQFLVTLYSFFTWLFHWFFYLLLVRMEWIRNDDWKMNYMMSEKKQALISSDVSRTTKSLTALAFSIFLFNICHDTIPYLI